MPKQELPSSQLPKSMQLQTGIRAKKAAGKSGNRVVYYTISANCLTVFINDTPSQTINLKDWLIERYNYNEIRKFTFFKKFRTWRVLKNWRQKIVRKRRDQVTQKLEKNLFILDDTFGEILREHKEQCYDLENYRIIDIQVTSDSFTMPEFKKRQELVREKIKERIARASNLTRQNFLGGIELAISDLKSKFERLSDADDDKYRGKGDDKDGGLPTHGNKRKVDMIKKYVSAKDKMLLNSKNQDKMIRKYIEKEKEQKTSKQEPIYEQLGFTGVLKYDQRSELREACNRFLRFSFLLDYVALWSLSKIYLYSIQDCNKIMRRQVIQDIDYDLNPSPKNSAEPKDDDMDMEFLEEKKDPPLFYATINVDRDASSGKTVMAVHSKDIGLIPAEHIYEFECERFVPPPVGSSKKEDFNPMVHLDLEPETEDQLKEFEPTDAKILLDEEDAQGDVVSEANDDDDDEEGGKKGNNVQYYVPPTEAELRDQKNAEEAAIPTKTVKNVTSIWLSIYPDKSEIQTALQEAFIQGQDALMNFEKWSMHSELAVYDSVLEPWDYRSYDKWAREEDEDTYLNCDEWLDDEYDFKFHEEHMKELVDQAVEKVRTQLLKFEPLLLDYWVNAQTDLSLLTNERLANPTDVLPLLLERFFAQKKMYETYIPVEKALGLLNVKFQQVKDALVVSPRGIIAEIKKELPLNLIKRVSFCLTWMNKYVVELKLQPDHVDKFVTQIQCLEYVEENFQYIKDKLELADRLFQMLSEFDMLGRDDKYNIFIGEAYALTNVLTNAIYDTKDKTDKNKDNMKRITTKKIPQLHDRVEEFQAALLDDKFLDLDPGQAGQEYLDIEDLIAELDIIEEQFRQIDYDKGRVQDYQKTLDMGAVDAFGNVEESRTTLMYRSRLWRSIKLWQENTKVWKLQPFEEIDIHHIQGQCTQITKTVLQCERNLPVSSAVQHLKKIVWDFKETMPVVEALGNPHLEQVHWGQIKGAIQQHNTAYVEEEGLPLEAKLFTLGELISYRVSQYQDLILNISVTASQEQNIRSQLDALQATWHRLDYDLVNHKTRDSFKIQGFDVIQQVIDDSMSQISIIMSSQYSKRHYAEVEEFYLKLNTIYELQEQIKECQRNWLYLENVFSSPDIKKQRQKDYYEFDGVNKKWNKIMLQINMQRNVRKNAIPARIIEFKKWARQLEKISRSLDTYLEEKRVTFPRFYFIANDELLKILANASDLKQIEKYITKCFENMYKLVLDEDDSNENANRDDGGEGKTTSDPLDVIYGVKSAEGEKILFHRSMKVRSQGVEAWMKQLDENMVLSVQRRIKEAYNHYYGTDAEETERVVWVLTPRHPSQAIAVVAQITWTEGTEMAVNDLVDENNPFAVRDHLLVLKQQLNELTALIRSNLTVIRRKILVALITQEVHQRDIVQKLLESKVSTCLDFQWQQQLRYYLEDELVILRQVNTSLKYGYEYLGPTTRLVITPLTDQCWITITGAMHISLGAAPSGPAGTGKTESTKDLAKACGVFCVVINCSDQIEYQLMAKLFSGVVQSGAWSCLDEFNRINLEVLSVIAQQLQDIRQAKVMGKKMFEFNGKERTLKKQCGIFITMNPGYKGRVELPDNLKILFRPVSMMIPEYRMIAEIMLFAEGFQQATHLSTKMVQLYKLASEQLSQQDHYDFGLRAVKSVLVMAGNLKRQNPSLDEDIVLIRAMRDSNVPKFLSGDIPLFQALIQDLFPEVEIPDTKHAELDSEIDLQFAEMRLENVDVIKKKTLQLFDTLNVRFGVMIVGPTGGGKTTTYQLLARCMNSLRKDKFSLDQRFQAVKFKVINPKAITMGELYGEVDFETQDWWDGLASKTLRKAALKTRDDLKNWCIFDGPVDAIWIENMNTVLDDNMTLCLVNGERIKLVHTIRIIFEVQDLAVASPATVSRCGMVYLAQEELPWRPIFASWVANYIQAQELLSKKQCEYLVDLFEQFADLTFERAASMMHEEQLPTIKNQSIRCVCNFLEYFINPTSPIKPDEKKQTWSRKIYSFFAFSLVWGFSASFKSSAHRFLDSIFRDFFTKLHLARADTIFQFYYDPKDMKFRHIENIVPQFEYSPEAPYFSLFVPTVDSVTYSRLLRMLLKINKSTFFTGGTGVGKSILIQEYLRKNKETMNLAPLTLSFSAQTTSIELQRMIESKLEKKRGKKVIGAKGTQQCIIFIDDINMPKVEEFGAQPPIELLRQLIDNGIWYDRPDFYKKRIENYRLICAAAPPGGGRAPLTPRFMRHFHIIAIPNANNDVLTHIFETMVMKFLTENSFNQSVQKCGNVAVQATIELFNSVNVNLLPIPSKFHYLFNLRDISKVFQGILSSRPQAIPESEQFVKLWAYECQRVFMDRLTNEADCNYFKELLVELIQERFKEKWDQEQVFGSEPSPSGKRTYQRVIFSSMLQLDMPEKIYEQISDYNKLLKIITLKIQEYNQVYTTNQMDLIMFDDAVDHICRITRILNQPRGNSMLIGVSGCGKQSLTKLSAFILEAQSFQIKNAKNYRPQNFRDDLKIRLMSSGCSAQENVFILNDTQITHTQFLEDINNILNTGELANLYDKEDQDKMQTSLMQLMRELKRAQSTDMIYQTYIEQLRDHFHVILCMSPVGDQLRIRCRNFPSLVNCCTLDWFNTWPLTALETVAKQYISQNAIVADRIMIDKFGILFPFAHENAQKETEEFYNHEKRRIYLTPKIFLDCLSLFKHMVYEKGGELDHKLKRLQTGVNKLDSTNSQIEDLQVILTDLVPNLLVQNEEAQISAAEISEKQAIAVKRESEAETEAQKVTLEAEELGKLKEQSEAELAKARPALLNAHKAVNELSRADIDELKKVNNPIPAVELALRCTLTYLGHHKIDWSLAQKALADMKFLDKLKKFDTDVMTTKTLDKIKKLTSKPEFNIEAMTKASRAAGGLAKWCYATRLFSEAKMIVAPLLEQQVEMTRKYEQAKMDVDRMQQEVKQIKQDIQTLQDNYQSKKDLIEKLNNDKVISERRLINASSLTELLKDERIRWIEEIEIFKNDISLLVGNMYLASCQINYQGPFSGFYRKRMLKTLINQCVKHQIPILQQYSLMRTTSDKFEVRSWNVQSLPSDQVSIDNGILATRALKWPLMIDPQNQGLTWLKKMATSQSSDGLSSKKFTSFKIPVAEDELERQELLQKLHNTLEYAIQNGHTLVAEDITEFIDPSIDQIVQKGVYQEQGRSLIVFGDKAIDYHPDFKMFLTTKLANPHYLPEIFIKTMIINFTVTFEGLNEQLLADVVNNLAPEVEKQRDSLVLEITRIQNEQQTLQSSILNELTQSNQETILDNDELIATLQISKTKSGEIAESLHQSVEVEETIDLKRNSYRQIANRGSLVYFVITALSSIDPMYQYSLEYVKKIFNETIIKVLQKIEEQEEKLKEKGQELQKSASDLNKLMCAQITDALYINVCQGLFEAHKIIFSFLIGSSIQKNMGEIKEDLYNLLIRGPGGYDRSRQPKHAHQEELHGFISEQQWDLCYCMQKQMPEHFKNFTTSILVQKPNWKKFQQADQQQNKGNQSIQATITQQLQNSQKSEFQNIPTPFNKIPIFFKLFIIKLFKPQNMIKAFKEYVTIKLGVEYSESPPSNLEILFSMSDPATPIIFVLSQGADPNEQILSYAKKQGFQDKLFQKSLGQGQERAAQELIYEGMEKGNWVLLQNCHLFKSWMPQLENLCNQIKDQKNEIHEDFRMILTSMPVDYFPSSVLQNGLKMTTEPPQGLKANLKRSFTNVIDRDSFYQTEKFLKETEEERYRIAAQMKLMEEQGETNFNSTTNISNLKDKTAAGYRPSLQDEFHRKFDLTDCWKSLLFGLSFFHSIIQERKKFGSLGWNIRYEFNDSDLDSSIKMLQNFIFEGEKIPWESMVFMTGNINYGGRVTDDLDRILLMSMLDNCYGPKLLDPNRHEQLNPKLRASRAQISAKKKDENQPEEPKTVLPFDFSFFDSGIYAIPRKHQKYSDIHAYIDSLPGQDSPEIFGMHSNAEIAYSQQQTNLILGTILNIPAIPVIEQDVGEAENEGEDNGGPEEQQKTTQFQKDDKTVMGLAQELYEKRPPPIKSDHWSKEIFRVNQDGLYHCYTIVVMQEQERYNRLIDTIETSLINLIRAIQGLEIMSSTLDQMYTCFLKNEVPDSWQAVSYASMLSLSEWYKDLKKRVDFVFSWMKNGHPSVYWLSGFFFPHGFMTGILQAYARKHLKAIDYLKFKFKVLNKMEPKECKEGEEEKGPENGVYIYGMFIEAARWDFKDHCLVEQNPGEMTYSMPMIHFLPFEVRHKVQIVQEKHPESMAASDIRNIEKGQNQTDLPKPETDVPKPVVTIEVAPVPIAIPSAMSKKNKKQEQIDALKAKEASEEVYVGELDTDALWPTLKYSCPVYKTSERMGVLSTTGQSTNYILSLHLPILPKELFSKARDILQKEHQILNQTKNARMKQHLQKKQGQSGLSSLELRKDQRPQHWTLRGTAIVLTQNL